MKTGCKVMQIPIQSLNAAHFKSYVFPFDETVFKYHMSTDELNKVKLVLQGGKEFEFVGAVIINEKKRDKKSNWKEEAKNGIDASELLEETRTKDRKRIKIFNEFGSSLYGNQCQFSSNDKGISYTCSHCANTLKVLGKSRKPLLFFN
jgi:hypothetical protein